MKTPLGHLTYCSNIHAGESWAEHFQALKQNIPTIKKQVSAQAPFGIGLRLSHVASEELIKKDALRTFASWLKQQGCYVFTMNGFPYGGFHRTKVKDMVHAPDWTTEERVAYTIRLANILRHLLPEEMDGGISTSPLSYKHWHTPEAHHGVKKEATQNLLTVLPHLMQLREDTGKTIHIDIEPEPDGMLETGDEFIRWYEEYLIPAAVDLLKEKKGLNTAKATYFVKEHIRLCYDVCHFAVGYEDHASIIKQLQQRAIKTGKIQISAALKATFPEDPAPVLDTFGQFNESTYLHQVVARQHDGTLQRYPDLPQALQASVADTAEWRAHFHVPLFVEDYGVLQSTRQDIVTVLALQHKRPFTPHLEIETYTWEVLPDALKRPLDESIIREINWVTKLVHAHSK